MDTQHTHMCVFDHLYPHTQSILFYRQRLPRADPSCSDTLPQMVVLEQKLAFVQKVLQSTSISFQTIHKLLDSNNRNAFFAGFLHFTAIVVGVFGNHASCLTGEAVTNHTTHRFDLGLQILIAETGEDKYLSSEVAIGSSDAKFFEGYFTRTPAPKSFRM